MTAAPPWHMERISCADLSDLPVKVRDVDGRMADMIAAWGRQDAAQFVSVFVAKTGSSSYAINDFEVIEGLRRAGVRTVQARVLDHCDTVGEIIMEHIRACLFQCTINPLKMRGDSLAKHGVNRTDLGKMLKVNRHHELARVVDCSISNEARYVLQKMVDQISKKWHMISVPPYYITKISKITGCEQSEAAGDLSNVTLCSLGRSNTFSWLSVVQVDTIIRYRPRAKRHSNGRGRDACG